MPALFGTLGLLAAMRALWFATLSRFASLAGEQSFLDYAWLESWR